MGGLVAAGFVLLFPGAAWTLVKGYASVLQTAGVYLLGMALLCLPFLAFELITGYLRRRRENLRRPEEASPATFRRGDQSHSGR